MGCAERLHRLSMKGDRAGGEYGVPVAVTGQVKMGVQGHKQSGSPSGNDMRPRRRGPHPCFPGAPEEGWAEV